MTPRYLSGLISQLSLLFVVFFFLLLPFLIFFQLSLLNQSGVWVLKQNPTLMNPNIHPEVTVKSDGENGQKARKVRQVRPGSEETVRKREHRWPPGLWPLDL